MDHCFKSFLNLLQYRFCFLFVFFFGREARGIPAPRPGIERVPPALQVWSLNHWTTREAPVSQFWNRNFIV